MTSELAPEQKFSEDLLAEISSRPDAALIPVMIVFPRNPAREFLDTNPRPGSSAAAIEFIRGQCAEQQTGLVDLLGTMDVEDLHPLWINNTVIATLPNRQLKLLRPQRDEPAAGFPEGIFWDLQRTGESTELADSDPDKNIPPSNSKTISPTVQKIGAPRLWKMGVCGHGVLVAVIDTGVNYRHPDLKQNMWDGGPEFPYHGYNFDNNNKDPDDKFNHGTLTAGIIAGDGTSGICTGVAPKATVMALRVVSYGGQSVPEFKYWQAMQFAVEQGADVISMSLTHRSRKPNRWLWRRCCEAILAAEVVHANSIGNNGEDPGCYPVPKNIPPPGDCPPPYLHVYQALRGGVSSVISCGDTDESDRLMGTSGHGPVAWQGGVYRDYPYGNEKQGLIKPDICARGIRSTSTTATWEYGTGNRYKKISGTSAATAHIGGCLALLVSACKRAGNPVQPARLLMAMEDSASKSLSSAGTLGAMTNAKQNHYGAGRVKICDAYCFGRNKNWW